MSTFEAFYQIGLKHILDKNGYDHILFVIALCALYQVDDLKRLLILVTAFTLGHSVTLALSTFEVISIDSELIEFLIPLTILVTAVSNLLAKSDAASSGYRNYFFAVCFGLIHGMGFSNYLKSLLGREESIVIQLFAFNVGLEVGQLIIVSILLAAGFLAVSILGVSQRDWRMVLSSTVTGMALVLIPESSYF